MNTRKSRILALGLSLCLAFSLCALPVRAAEGEEDPPAAPLQNPAAPALTARHVRYIQGIPDGRFLPEGKLTRAQAAQMVHRLLEDPEGGTEPVSYTDIPADEWYAGPVSALRALGLFDDGEFFRPADVMTRAEFVSLLVRLRPEAAGEAAFPDVPEDHWARQAIGAAVALGWINGFPDGRFGPEEGLSRAEACTILGRVAGRAGDSEQARLLLALGLFTDVPADHWAGTAIAEAAVAHTPAGETPERWAEVDWSRLSLRPGFHQDGERLYYVDRTGKPARDTALGAYTAGPDGQLFWTALSYRIPEIPYLSQLDNGLNAWVACEPVSALSGLWAKGFASGTDPRQFIDGMPRAAADPEKGFVGSPYVPDAAKTLRTTIYPAALAAYCNQFCGGQAVCADFRGASVLDLQREVLAGNCVVAYMTFQWQAPQYRAYQIDGKSRRLVSNNQTVLVCGYDPEQGYFVSDPYNRSTPGQALQYWVRADVFESIWNERKTGMVIR